MIAALARGAQLLNEPVYANAAARAVDFIYQNLHTPDGRLLHRFRNNHAALPPSVDDYAFLTWALLELYEATFDIDYLKKALNLQQSLNQHFWNDAAGGFFFTPDDGEKLLIRQIEIYDGAVPSGNSVALLNLLKLARITGNLEFENQAATMYRLFSPQVQTAPIPHSQMLLAVDFAVGPAYEVVIAGRSDAPDTTKMINTLRKKYLPNKVQKHPFIPAHRTKQSTPRPTGPLHRQPTRPQQHRHRLRLPEPKLPTTHHRHQQNAPTAEIYRLTI